VISTSTEITIVGVDCAVRPENTGLTFADYSPPHSSLFIWAAEPGCRASGRVSSGRTYHGTGVAERIAERLGGRRSEGVGADRSNLDDKTKRPLLLALDAPLGWPEAMGAHLAGHNAGRPIDEEANVLFRRFTDRRTRELIGKTPLDVGADRIARTALAALRLIGELEVLLDLHIETAEDPDERKEAASIEVYPAGTLLTGGLLDDIEGNRKSGENPGLLLPKLAERYSIALSPASGENRYGRETTVEEAILKNEHVFDSLVCACAAKDFLEGRTVAPRSEEERRLAKKEGWIWLRID
jgi:hypothetical protein